jgi:hypothetical protein
MPSCQTRVQLADQFTIATRLYYEAVVDVTRNHVPISASNYRRLREAAEDARSHAEALRIAFNEHVDSHRCGSHDGC